MSSYSISYGSTRDSSSSTCSSIQTNWEMQQLCGVAETVSKVPDTEDTIKFMLDTQQFTYTVDVFRDTLHLPMETPENPFVAPANIHTIEAFMNIFGYQGVVDKDFMNNVFQKKEAIQYPRFIKLIVADLMKKFPNIPKRLEEDYHSIKDNVPLVSVYTTGNVLVRGMLIPDVFLTEEIRETDDFNEYEMVFMKDAYRSASPHESKKRKQTAGESSSRRIIVKKKKQSTPSIPPPRDDRERDEMAEATLLSLTLHKTALDAKAKENIAKVQEMLEQEEIDKLVDGDEDEESYASAFADSVINNDDDDTGSKLEPGSHKEHPEHVSDDVTKRKDEEVEKEKEVVEIVKGKNVDDISAKKNNEVVMEKEVVNMSGSQEIRKEQKQTLISSPIRSPRNDLSSDKTISEELADTFTPTNATSSKTPSTTTRKKKSFTLKTRHLPGSIAGMCRRRGLIRSHIKTKFITREFFVEKIKEVIQHCDKIVPELTVTMTNEMLKKDMPRLVKLAVNKDREVSSVDISGMVSKEFAAHGPKLIEELFRKHMLNTTLNLYPKTNSSTATTSSADLQQQLYLSFKPQKEYRHVPKKPNNSSSGNKKKRVEPTSEVSNSNPFDVINSVDNDVEFGTNRGTTNLENNRAISSGSSFMNIDNDEEFVSNTPIGEKIDKIKRQIGDGKLRLLDNDGNLLVPTGIVESDSEVEVVFNETDNLRIPMSGKDESDKGYGTNSLLEQ
ncbi:hypothetical protein Tco_0877216 [Tanacetum coccineum]|uniref:Uncharacterized protein n=1 Tax=Tanacetum coccineum TaxID=301880 RepID=A0ABQ5BUH1_9ASTR